MKDRIKNDPAFCLFSYRHYQPLPQQLISATNKYAWQLFLDMQTIWFMIKFEMAYKLGRAVPFVLNLLNFGA